MSQSHPWSLTDVPFVPPAIWITSHKKRESERGRQRGRGSERERGRGSEGKRGSERGKERGRERGREEENNSQMRYESYDHTTKSTTGHYPYLNTAPLIS